ncbi:MAG: PIN domain-containing protein [Phycisphaerales bacterium]
MRRYVALLNRQDSLHLKALTLAQESSAPSLVTTQWVLVEVANSLSRLRRRRAATQLLMAVVDDPQTEVVVSSDDLFHAGLGLFRERLDKEWSLTDCISFVVMRQRRLTAALTADHHFAQAGFEVLLG